MQQTQFQILILKLNTIIDIANKKIQLLLNKDVKGSRLQCVI